MELRPSDWFRMVAVAAASAAAGGLAAAWFYRKTLARLREAEANNPDGAAESRLEDTGEEL